MRSILKVCFYAAPLSKDKFHLESLEIAQTLNVLEYLPCLKHPTLAASTGVVILVFA